MRGNISLPVVAIAMSIFASSVLADTLQTDAQNAATKWDEAYNSGDMETLGKLYTSDAIVITKGCRNRAKAYGRSSRASKQRAGRTTGRP